MSDYRNEETTSWNSEQIRGAASHQPPEQHRRQHRREFSKLRYFLVVLVVSMVLAGIGWLLINDLCAFNKKEATATIEITSEDTVGSVATKLKDAGLIQYKGFFKLFAGFAHAKDKIGIGSYELNTDMDYRALIAAMHNASGGLGGDTVQVTIPEGYTVSQILALLAQKGVNTEDALTEAAQTATFDYNFIDNSSEDVSRLEGYLFPDTYEFYVNEKASSALGRLIKNFDSKMDEDRLAKVESSQHSLKEIITVASLIEKETDGTDQAKIASVIYNRLKDSGSHGTYQMLQIDASLLYALPDHTGTITNDDKKVDSPYNLYKNAGLPPTPIANPGMEAIDAALNPETTDYYFYGLGTDHVHHYFKTYDEFQTFLKSDQYGG